MEEIVSDPWLSHVASGFCNASSRRNAYFLKAKDGTSAQTFRSVILSEEDFLGTGTYR